MNAKPRLFDLTEPRSLRIIPACDDVLVIECEVVNPPSSAGRTVYVYFDVEETTMLLREVKAAASRVRARAMTP